MQIQAKANTPAQSLRIKTTEITLKEIRESIIALGHVESFRKFDYYQPSPRRAGNVEYHACACLTPIAKNKSPASAIHDKQRQFGQLRKQE
jgi:hypothetical protein